MRKTYAAVLLLCFLVLLGGYRIQGQSEPREVILKPVGNLAVFDLEEITATAGLPSQAGDGQYRYQPGHASQCRALECGA